jgi:plastocyanin
MESRDQRGFGPNAATTPKHFFHDHGCFELLTEIHAGDNKGRTIYIQSTFDFMLKRAAKFLVFATGVTLALPICLAALDNNQEVHAGEATGTVFGRVSLAGHHLIKPKPLPVFKNRAFCGATVPDETLLVGADGGLTNAVVVFRAVDRTMPVRPGALTLDNRQCAFAPHVQVAVVGSELLLKNSDPILHTVHARMGSETLFNVGLPTWRRVTKRLDRAGVVKINCDVLHTWMSAAIVVTDSPFFALTDGGGDFKIDNLSAGDYVMETWHERLGFRQQRIVISSAALISLHVVYALDQSDR